MTFDLTLHQFASARGPMGRDRSEHARLAPFEGLQ